MREIAVEPARTGDLTASAGSLRIHSAHDPKRESRRFLAERIPEFRRGATVIIVGAGLGYLDEELRRQRPDLTLLACHLLPELANRIHRADGVPRWNPDRGDAGEFISSHMGELDLPGLRVLEWEPAIRAAPEIAAAVSAAVSAAVRRHSGNISTTAAFGRRWIRNILRNYAEVELLLAPEPQTGTTVIAGSGPSLENALEALGNNRDRCRLWALPSAVRTLAGAGIRPDLVFSTDPGFWARFHWRYFPRDVPVAMPLSSSPPPEPLERTLLIFDGSLGETELFGDQNWPGLRLPRAGSVAITAVEAWKCLVKGPLVLVGLDFAWRDLRSHARPHAFDGWLGSFDSRVRPGVSTAWERASLMAPTRIGAYRSGCSLATYRDWFRTNPLPNGVYRFRPRGNPEFPVPLAHIGGIDETKLHKLPRRSEQKYRSCRISLEREERRERIRKVIHGWIGSVDSSVTIDDIENNAVIYTIDPGGILDLKRLGDSATDRDRDEVRTRVRDVLEAMARFYD